MAKRTPAWADRRWKLFEKEYENNHEFKARINNICEEKDSLNKIAHVGDLLYDSNLPSDLLIAACEFIKNPNLAREHYIQYIAPPVQFWSTSANKAGPSIKSPTKDNGNVSGKLTFTNISKPNVINPDFSDTAEGYLNLILESSNIELTIKGSNVRGVELGNLLSDGNLMLRVNPYTTKGELEAFIDEFWDELAPLINSNSGDAIFSQKLIGNIHRAKNDDEKKREQLIMKLTEAGESDLYIQTQLSKKGFGFVTVENIRQIRFRFKRKRKK